MLEYARQLQRMGHRVGVYTSDESAHFNDEQTLKLLSGLDISHFRTGTLLSKYYFNYSFTEIVGWLNRRLAEFDVVHVAQTRTIANVALQCALLKHNTPYVLSAFGSLPRREHGLKTLYDPLFVAPLVKNACGVLAQTAHEADAYRQFGAAEDRVHSLPLCVNTADLRSVPNRDHFRRSLGIDSTCTLFLFLGRLHQTKGVSHLIDSFAAACRGRNAVLALVGNDCGVGDALKDQVAALGMEHKIRFLAPIFGMERTAAYSGADYYVITPRVFEETPLAALEALSCGTAVVTNFRAAVPGLDEYGAGRTVSDDLGLPDVLRELCEQSTDCRAEVRRRARALAIERFDSAVVGSRLADILARSISN